MSYDPAWDMPQINWQQQGSWEEGSIPPVTEPDAGTQICLGPVAQEWVPWIAGACDQMRNPSAWIVADDTAMYNTLRRVDTLLGLLFGARGGCGALMIRLNNCILQTSSDGGTTWVDVPGWDAGFCECVINCNISLPPLLPPGSPPETRACNIAGYLADHVIHEAITQAIESYNNNLTLLAFAGNLAAATFAFELPWTAAFVFAAYDVYQFFTAANIASLQSAEADSAFWNLVRCAIYNAIKADGLITVGNCAAVINNICNITYGDGVAVQAVCAFVTQLGCDQLRSIQVAGALNAGDCSTCGGPWCYYFDFKTSSFNPTWHIGNHGTWVSGRGYQADNGTQTLLNFESDLASPTTLSHITIHWRTDSGAGAAARGVYFYLAGSLVHTWGLSTGSYPSGITEDTPLSNIVCDRIQVEIDSTYNLATTWCEFVQLKGIANTPYGASNCVP